MDGQGKSMKAQLKYANKINAKYVIILGDDELARGEASLSDSWILVNKRLYLSMQCLSV